MKNKFLFSLFLITSKVLTVDGNFNNLNVSGLNGSSNFYVPVFIKGNDFIVGAGNSSGNLVSNNLILVGKGIFFGKVGIGNVIDQSNLTVSINSLNGDINTLGNLTVGKDANFNGNFSVGGNKFFVNSLSGDCEIIGKLSMRSLSTEEIVTDSLEVKGNETISGTLDVAGNTNLDSNLNVYGQIKTDFIVGDDSTSNRFYINNKGKDSYICTESGLSYFGNRHYTSDTHIKGENLTLKGKSVRINESNNFPIEIESGTATTTICTDLDKTGSLNMGGPLKTLSLRGTINIGNSVDDKVITLNSGIGNTNITAGTFAVTGNETISGTLNVTGETTLAGLTASGTTIDSLAVTNNETVGGTLGVTGDVLVNTDKFNIEGTSGNTTVGGTLGVSGETTLAGLTAGVTTIDSLTVNDSVSKFVLDNKRKPVDLFTSNVDPNGIINFGSYYGENVIRGKRLVLKASSSLILNESNDKPIEIESGTATTTICTDLDKTGSLNMGGTLKILNLRGTINIGNSADDKEITLNSGTSNTNITAGTFAVTGNETISGTLNVGTNEMIGGTLSVTGDTTLNANLTVNNLSGVDVTGSGYNILVVDTDGKVYKSNQDSNDSGISSIRFKENIRNVFITKEVFEKMVPIIFDYKEKVNNGKKNQWGLIAEDLEKLGFVDALEYDRSENLYGINYRTILMALMYRYLQTCKDLDELSLQYISLKDNFDKLSSSLNIL